MAELTMDNPLLVSPTVTSALKKGVDDLKDCIAKLKEEFEGYRIPINDDNHDLQRFCSKLEFILQFGMKTKSTILGAKKDYWNYIQECIGTNKGLRDGVKFVKSLNEIKTNLGRGRALIRFALMHQRLADTIQNCASSGKISSDWYAPHSIWLQHKLSSEVVNVLYDLNDIQFDLSSEGYDLDNAWPSFARKTLNFNSPLQQNWQPPSRSMSFTSLQSTPQDHDIEDIEEKLRKRILDLEDENHDLQRRCNDFEVNCEKFKNELALKVEMWDEKETGYKMKQNELEVVIKDLQDKSDDVTDGREKEINEISVQVTQLEKMCNDLKSELTIAKKDLEAKTKVDETKSALINIQEKRIEQLQRENNLIVDENKKNQTEAEQLLSVKCSEMQKVIDELEKKNGEHENAFSKVVKQNEELKEMLHSLQSKSRDLAEISKQKISAYVEENKNLKESLADIETYRKEISGLKKENSELLDTIEHISQTQQNEIAENLIEEKKQKNIVVESLKDLQEKHDTLAKEMQKKEEEYGKLSNELDSKRDELQSAFESVRNMRDVVLSYIREPENETSKDNILSDNTIFDLISLIQSKIKVSCDGLEEKMKKLVSQNEQYVTDITMLKETKMKLTSKIDILEQKCDEQLIELELVRKEIITLKNELEDSKNNIVKLQADKEEFKKSSTDLLAKVSERDEIISGLGIRLNEVETHESETEKKIDELNSLILDKDHQYEVLQIELSSMKEQCTTLEKDKEKISTDANQSYFELKEKLGQSQTEVDVLKEELTKITSEKNSTFETWNEKNKALDEQCQALRKENEEVSSNLSDCKEKNEALSNENKALSLELHSNEKIHSSQLSKLQEDLSMSNEKVSSLELELNNKEIELKQKIKEIEIQEQEMSALQFQLSTFQMKEEQEVQCRANESSKVQTLSEQNEEMQSLIEALQLELTERKNELESENMRHTQEIQDFQLCIAKKEHEIEHLKNEYQSKSKIQEEHKSKEMAHLKNENEKQVSVLKNEIEQLQTDITHLKKKLIQVTKDKDHLWQKTDQLAYLQRLKASETWMDSNSVSKCLSCDAQFSFLLRKHHCRLCGRIYCYDCCNNWVMTAHSHKKERVCCKCVMEQSQLEATSEGEDSGSDNEATATEYPDRRSHKPEEVEIQDNHASDDIHSTTSHTEQQIEGSNSTAEIEPFDVITQEEVQESGTDTLPDPCALSSALVTEDVLIVDGVEAEPELWITAGRSYLVPISISSVGLTIKWEFTTSPKDINFSLTFCKDEPKSEDEVLLPMCKCNSHKKAISGELTVHQPGVYTLIFDNKSSRFTSKKLHYTLSGSLP